MTPYRVTAGRLGPITVMAGSARQAERAFGTIMGQGFDDRRASSAIRFAGSPARSVSMTTAEFQRARMAGVYEASTVRRSLAGTPRG